MPRDAEADGKGAHGRFWALTLGSVGVVYGDIGTSPLYAFREAMLAAAGGDPGSVTRADVLGVVSLILWALILIVTAKYVLILLRADNGGEGGTLALMALAQRALGGSRAWLVALGIAGAALFFGDAIITPAISVLSAVEGLKLVTPAFEPVIVPLSAAIIVGLFLVQSRGTERIARFFGPITALWFLAMGVAGASWLARDPGMLAAFNPAHAVAFLAENGLVGLATLGAVFLAVTGAEALYADLGHFGRRPIQAAWAGLVFPVLALNYLGQGALVLADPGALANPFYLLVPGWALTPMVALATMATIIASQAVITGAFSLTRQAIQLGLLPRLEIRHTSEALAGQIYLPRINALLLVGVLVLVLAFQTSGALAAAYGTAVTATMVVTATMAFTVLRRVWGWPVVAVALTLAPLLALDLVFFAANLMKVADGGWVPLALAAGLGVVMLTWRRGTRILAAHTRRREVPLDELAASLAARPPQRTSGTAIFLTADPERAPSALLHSLKHYRVLHARNLVVTVAAADVPRIDPAARARVERLSDDTWRVVLTYGFMETPNVPRALARLEGIGGPIEPATTSYFLSRRHLRASARSGMPLWQDHLFIRLARASDDASDYFRIPFNRVVEIGSQVLV